jgi:hypothetical protein
MATRANITIDQGATFSTVLNLTDQNGNIINLTDYTVAAQVKKWYTSVNSVSFGATINSAAGSITLSLTSNQTSLMWAGRYVYDVIVTDSSNNVSRIVEGEVVVTPGVTNEALETFSNTNSYEAYFSNTGFNPV